MRNVFAYVAAAAVVVACGSATERAVVAPSEPAGSATTTAAASAAPIASAPPSPSVAPSRPAFDERRDEAILACKRAQCWSRGRGCFDACYKYNHPFNPQGHERCNESCRRSYGVDACEAKCERETK